MDLFNLYGDCARENLVLRLHGTVNKLGMLNGEWEIPPEKIPVAGRNLKVANVPQKCESQMENREMCERSATWRN